VQWQ